jgi:hypothetical protein
MILAENGWADIRLKYWTYRLEKKYVDICHINKFFPLAVWKLNHNVLKIKLDKSIWSILHFIYFVRQEDPWYLE